MGWHLILGSLAVLSFLLALWQWLVARKFPLHQRRPDSCLPVAVSLLKPLKGCDDLTEECLRSWFQQQYHGPIQILFGVASDTDPVCAVVRKLMAEFPQMNARLEICPNLRGPNLKVEKLARLEKLAVHDVLVISDADVRVPPDFLAQALEPLWEFKVALVNCFYTLANPANLAMHIEAVAINADFWSQVLQARCLEPMNFALGAVMALRKKDLYSVGGFEALQNCLADDYQLGHRLSQHGDSIELATVVVDCCSAPMGWSEVWQHQLRWARTIRVCQAGPYFFSILSNATVWPCLWLVLAPHPVAIGFGIFALIFRMGMAFDLQGRLTRRAPPILLFWLPLLKDLLQFLVWAQAFLGNTVEWRGQVLRLRKDGSMWPAGQGEPAAASREKAAIGN